MSPSRRVSSAVKMCYVGCVLMLPGVFAHDTSAQQVISMTRSVGGPGQGVGGSMISKRSFEGYAKLLKLSPEQSQQATALYDAYVAGYRAEQSKMSDAMRELQRSSEDSGDTSVFMEKLPKIQGEYKTATTKLERDMMTDIKATLTSEQEVAWPRVERMRRREVELRSGGLSGEGLDLIAIATELKLSSDGSSPVDQLLETYESDMDRTLVARAAQRDDDAEGFEPGKPIDIEKLTAQLAKSKEAGAKVRDLNRDYVRKLEALLTPEQLSAFQDGVKKASFPRVYRTPRVVKDAQAALALTDLSEVQRETIKRAYDDYLARAIEVNSNWAKAISENEEKGAGGTLGGGGNQINLSMGDDPENLKEARKARRELDDSLAARVKETLSEGQFSRLPKGEDDESFGPRPNRTMMIRREE
jgi:Spy/CpxP family protein refolding chaperone